MEKIVDWSSKGDRQPLTLLVPAGGGSADLEFAAALGSQVTGPTMATALLLWRFSTLYIPLLVGALSLVVLTCKWRTNATVTTETRN